MCKLNNWSDITCILNCVCLIGGDQLCSCVQVCVQKYNLGGCTFTNLHLLSYISISAGFMEAEVQVPHLNLLLNAEYAADTAWEVFLLCFILFPRCYILTLTFGCDKRKAFNPTHIHSEFRPLDPNSTPTLQRAVTGLRSPAQCSDSGCMHEAYSHFLSLASAMLMTERLRVFLSVAERSCFLCAVCISLSIVSFSTNGSLSHSFLGSAVVWAAHLKLHQSSRRQKKSCGSAVRRMRYNRGSKCHLDDCLQHFSVVLPSDVHCAACSSTVYSGWAAAVRRFSVTFSAVQLDFSSV